MQKPREGGMQIVAMIYTRSKMTSRKRGEQNTCCAQRPLPAPSLTAGFLPSAYCSLLTAH